MATQFGRNTHSFGFLKPIPALCHVSRRLPTVRWAANPQQQNEAETVALQAEAISPIARWSASEASIRSDYLPASQQQQQQELLEDVQHLEQSFLQPSAAPSPEPDAALQATAHAAASSEHVAASVGAATADGSDSASLRLQLRSTYIRQALPLCRTVRTAERKLGAELSAVGFAIILMVAVIMYDRGWNNMLDRFDESVLGDVCCMIAGLGMVFGVKLMGWQPKDYFNV